MPLERFIPKSPDPFIRNSQDFEVAKFGHLNTIIEYVNTYVVTDSLQLDGTGPLTSTARYITDSLGNASSLAISSGNIGIGTTNATARLRVISADTNGIAEFFQNGNTAAPLHLTRYGGNVPINLNTSGGTSTSPVPVGDNIQMSRITTNTYNGTAFGTSARIEVLSKGIQSATNYGSVMRFLTTPENATSMNEVMSLTSDGNVQIGIGYLVAGGAKLAIKGSGSTSATSSLLVQNSGGLVALEVLDDSRVKLGNSSDFTVYSGAGVVSRFAMNVGSTSLPTAQLQVKGSGSTSATTSLLVQNSGGTESLKVQDDNIVRTTYLGIGGGTSTNNIGGTHIAQFGNAVSAGDQIIVVDSVSGSKRGFKFGNQGTIRMALIQDGVNLQIGNYVNPSAFVPYTTFDYSTGNVGIGTTSPTAKTHIVGSGSTSATTSLLVQNVGGTNLLQQKDNGDLLIGTTASGLGRIYVPHDSGYGQRVFMGIQAGVNLMATQSNDGLVFKANYNIFDGSIYNNSGYFLGASTGSGTDTSAYYLNTGLQPFGAANSNIININGGGRLQGSSTGNYIQVSSNQIIDSPVNILRGFYFNPTLSGVYSNANVFAVHSTYGGAYLNTATPNASAILQADSTTQGFLPPRMTTTQRTAIVSPAAGLIVYDTTTNKSYTYDGTAWQAHY